MGMFELAMKLAPRFMRGPNGQKWLGVSASFKEQSRRELFQAVRVERGPSTCADEALELVASNFNTWKYQRESEAQFRARLLTRTEDEKDIGTTTGLIRELERAGFEDVQIIEGWQYVGPPTLGEWFSAIALTCILDWTPPPPLGGTLPMMLGHGIPREVLRDMQRIIKQWKGPGATFHQIEIAAKFFFPISVQFIAGHRLGVTTQLPFRLADWAEDKLL